MGSPAATSTQPSASVHSADAAGAQAASNTPAKAPSASKEKIFLDILTPPKNKQVDFLPWKEIYFSAMGSGILHLLSARLLMMPVGRSARRAPLRSISLT
jgi:hypothetical protein